MDSRESSRFTAPLAQRVAGGAGSREIADAIGAMWSDIESALQPVLGRHGVAALFTRVLHVTAASYPWLAPAPARVAELTARFAAQPPGVVMEAGSALFMNFRELLATLIGSKLSERLLQAAWSTPSSAPSVQDPTP